MGAIDDETGFGPMAWGGDGGEYFELTVSKGSSASHMGISLGPVGDDDTAARVLGLLAAALQGATALESAINALPTLSGGPWAGVVPSTWLASRSSAQKTLILTRIRTRARSVAWV